MVLCFCLIASVIILEAGPVYSIVMADLRGQSISLFQLIWAAVSSGFAFFFCVLSAFYPIYRGEKKLLIK